MFFFNQKIFKIVIYAGLIFCLFATQWGWGFETREIGVVTVPNLNMRLKPGSTYPVVEVLKKDDQVRVLSHADGWLQVMHDTDVGYVADRSGYLKLYTIHSVTDNPQTDLQFATAKSEDIRQKIKVQTAEVAKYTSREKELIDKLTQTDQALNNARKEKSAIQSDLAVVIGNISEMQEKVDQAQQAIDKRNGYAVKRLVSLYKLNKLGEVNLLASATSLYDLMHRQAAMKKILNYDYQVIDDLAEKKNYLSGLLDQLNEQKNKKVALSKKYQAVVGRLAKEKQEREKVLTNIREKKVNRLASIKYLKNASIKLAKTINALRQGNTSGMDEANNFSDYQGLLKMPVSGKVISKFGKYIEPHSGAPNFRNGIEIQSRSGSPIRAVFSGKTIYSSWLKGYGNVIIIAHGENYYTVYAHAEELFRAKGDHVETGEVIGTVGDTGSINGPSLYFEIRHKGTSVDPLEWINHS